MPKREYTRRLWLPEEDSIVDRHARALAAGRYPDIWRAAEACQSDIVTLYAGLRKTDPAHYVATRERPFESIRHRIPCRLGVLGLSWTGRELSPAEERIVSRYAQALAQGRYRHAREAAVACKPHLERLRKGAAPLEPRSLFNIQRYIYFRAPRTGRSWSYVKWHPDDDGIIRRYAVAVVSGKYPTAVAALQDCGRELKTSGRRPGRTAGAVRARLLEFVRASGVQRYPRWHSAEERVYRQHLRLLFEGRYKYARDAADACAASMLRLRGTVRPRSSAAIHTRMNHEVAGLGLPRFKGETMPEERRLFEKYARAVAAGRYVTCLDATPACHGELERIYARIGKLNPLRVRRLPGRSRDVVHRRILDAADRLGLQFPGRRWLPAEQRVFDGWQRWYSRYRHVRRLQPLTQAATGMSDDLAEKGFRRSVCSCKERLATTRRRQLGLA